MVGRRGLSVRSRGVTAVQEEKTDSVLSMVLVAAKYQRDSFPTKTGVSPRAASTLILLLTTYIGKQLLVSDMKYNFV